MCGALNVFHGVPRVWDARISSLPRETAFVFVSLLLRRRPHRLPLTGRPTRRDATTTRDVNDFQRLPTTLPLTDSTPATHLGPSHNTPKLGRLQLKANPTANHEPVFLSYSHRHITAQHANRPSPIARCQTLAHVCINCRLRHERPRRDALPTLKSEHGLQRERQHAQA